MWDNISMKKTYQSKEWLRQQYWGFGLSTRQIAKQVGCDDETIRHWLMRFDISRRPATNINYVSLTPELLELLDGHLLGDMSVVQERKQSASLSQGNKHQVYLNWLSNLLSAYHVEKRGQIKEYQNKVGKSWIYHSRYYRDFVALRERWYPDGRKVVPADIKLTPITVRDWFLDDGSFFKAKGNVIGRVDLATNAFIRREVEFLTSRLVSAIGSNSIHVHEAMVGWTIQFSEQKTVQRFFDYIGACPEGLEFIYGYKWPSHRVKI
jgi:hypothetical protein